MTKPSMTSMSDNDVKSALMSLIEINKLLLIVSQNRSASSSVTVVMLPPMQTRGVSSAPINAGVSAMLRPTHSSMYDKYVWLAKQTLSTRVPEEMSGKGSKNENVKMCK